MSLEKNYTVDYKKGLVHINLDNDFNVILNVVESSSNMYTAYIYLTKLNCKYVSDTRLTLRFGGCNGIYKEVMKYFINEIYEMYKNGKLNGSFERFNNYYKEMEE